jgi:hypothetical protein
MIDYEKLKIVCQLAEKLSRKDKWVTIEIEFTGQNGLENYGLTATNEACLYFGKKIDELITTLTELTQSKSKYEIGQEVWLIDCDEICTAKIKYHKDNDEYVLSDCKTLDGWDTGGNWKHPDKLYPTKQSLIDSQIEYWNKLKLDFMEPKMELKIKITDLMWKFTEKYGTKGPNCLYPNCGKILVNVINSCLKEAKKQIGCESEDGIECQHERDGAIYCNTIAGYKRMMTHQGNYEDTKYKCKKCGEYYK